MDVGGRGDGGRRDAVGRDHDVVLGPGLAAVGGVGTGQLAAALGPDRATVDDHVPGDLGSRARHADQDGVDPAQHGRRAPAVQAAAQGRATGAPGLGPQLPPLDALAHEEAERLDDLDGRHGRSTRARRSLLDPVDDPSHQLRRARRHARLPLPEARETNMPSARCPEIDEPSVFWKLPLKRQLAGSRTG